MSDTKATGHLVPFQYGNTSVRTINVDGEPWFVASDVARILEYRDAYNMVRRIDEEDRGTRSVSTPFGSQDMTVISEAGVYASILGSQSASARKVKHWLTHEVLPEIRRTGTYTAPSAKPALTEDEIVLQALQIQGRKIEALTERVAELEPKADLADNFLIAQGGARLVGQVGKSFGMKQVEFRRFLIDEKLVFTRHAPCGDVQYEHYAQFAHHFQTRETVVNHTWGVCSHYTLYILPRGVELIRKRMADAGSLVLA
jgi:anti-repressor protein